MSWNVFKFCTALRALGSIMILLVLGIVGLSYYALVVVNYGPALFRGGLNSLTALLVLLLFHSLVIYFPLLAAITHIVHLANCCFDLRQFSFLGSSGLPDILFPFFRNDSWNANFDLA